MAGTVLFVVPYPLGYAPSQRFRVEEYFPLLKKHDLKFEVSEFFDDKAWNILYRKGSKWQKVFSVLKGFYKRFWLISFRCRKYSFIFIHREAAPLGPPLFEWWIAKILRKRIIYDFDDAIWIPNVSEGNRVARFVKCSWKIKWICKWSYKVSAGNDYLKEWAKRHQSNVILNPTCVDTARRYNRIKEQETGPVTIGWTGSHSTLRYLDLLSGILKQLEEEYPIEVVVVCDREPSFGLRSLRFIPWNEASEIDDLLRFNIGVMPLAQDAWSEGKCGFKLIQYLALGIPAVASPIGVNKQIIEQEGNGFLCSTEEEWRFALRRLINDQSLRTEMGERGQRKISEHYSVQANASNFLSLFS